MVSSALPLLFFLLSVLLGFGASSSSLLSEVRVVRGPLRSRLLPRAINDPDAADAAVDLTATNFDAVLRESPASFAIVEFAAHWSPACRKYKPHYEKVARLFNGPDAVHPGIMLMTRVDCGLKMNDELCKRFSIGRYPMLLWGPSLLFASGGWKPKQQKSEIMFIDDRSTADRLLNWINKQIGSEFNLEDEKHENERQPLPNASEPEQVLVKVYDLKHWMHVFLKVAHELSKIPEKMADIWGKHGGLGSSSASLSGRPGAVYLKRASVSNGDRKEAPVGGVEGHISRVAFGNKPEGYFQDLLSARKAKK